MTEKAVTMPKQGSKKRHDSKGRRLEQAASSDSAMASGRPRSFSEANQIAELKAELSVAVKDKKAAFAKGAREGLLAGLRYSSARRLDLSRLASTDAKTHLEEVAEHCGDLEALFLSPGTVLGAELLGSLRSQWKHSVCLVLGCEVSEAAYVNLREQYERHDEELAGAPSEISEGVPPSEPEPEPEQPDGLQTRGLAHVDRMAGGHGHGIWRTLDLTDPELFDGLTDAGLAEIPKFCPEVTVLLLPSRTKVTRGGLEDFRRQCPSAVCVELGAEIGRAELLAMLQQYRQSRRLDLSGREFCRVSDRGLLDIARLCPRPQAVFTPRSSTAISAVGLEQMRDACAEPPSCVLLGREISAQAYQALKKDFQEHGTVDITGEEMRFLDSQGLAEIQNIPDFCSNLKALFYEHGSAARAAAPALEESSPRWKTPEEPGDDPTMRACKCLVGGQGLRAAFSGRESLAAHCDECKTPLTPGYLHGCVLTLEKGAEKPLTCAICRSEYQTGYLHSCRECDYDICESCFDKDAFPDGHQRLLCLAGAWTVTTVKKVVAEFGIRVTTATSTEQAVAQLQQGSFDYVVAGIGENASAHGLGGEDSRLFQDEEEPDPGSRAPRKSALLSAAKACRDPPCSAVVFSKVACRTSLVRRECLDAGAEVVLCEADPLYLFVAGKSRRDALGRSLKELQGRCSAEAHFAGLPLELGGEIKLEVWQDAMQAHKELLALQDQLKSKPTGLSEETETVAVSSSDIEFNDAGIITKTLRGAAAQAELLEGSKIVRVGGAEVGSKDEITAEVQKLANQPEPEQGSEAFQVVLSARGILLRDRDAARRKFIDRVATLTRALEDGGVLSQRLELCKRRQGEREIAVGDRVRISGIHESPEYENGLGTVMERDSTTADDCRISIEGTKLDELLQVKADVLTPVTPEMAEIDAWQRMRADARQLSVFAGECKRVIAADEPSRSIAKLEELQRKDEVHRRELQTAKAEMALQEEKFALAEAKAVERSTSISEAPRSSARLWSIAKRSQLMERPMTDWSESQVIEWFESLDLPAADLEAVTQALRDDETDGEDLKELSTRRLSKLLKKSGVADRDAVAGSVMELHEAAVDAATAAGGGLSRTKTAASQLTSAKKTLRDNNVEIQSLVVNLVSLAAQHFPELSSHPAVEAFMGTAGVEDGSEMRRLTDYDDIKPLVLGRNELLRARYRGVDVCLKRFSLQDESDTRAFRKEIGSVQRMKHPYIVKYTAVFEDDKSMYVQMDYCAQGSMRKWLEGGPDVAQKRSMLRQILLAIACIHSHKMLHCDLKAENVLVADDGTPRVCDFEMTRDLDAAVQSTTIVGGTRGFMAPEILSGAAKPSAASDIYAFGVIIINTIHVPEPDAYPLTDPALVTAPALKALVPRLLSPTPGARPSAAELQAEPYFASERVDEWGRVEMPATSSMTCCEEMLVADPVALGVPDMKDILEQVEAHLRMKLGTDVEATERNIHFTILLYTIQSNVYPRFNDALRERPPGALFDAWSPFLGHLLRALRSLPDHACTVYRGVPDPPNLSGYVKSSRIHWSGFSSTSTDPKVAKLFSSGAPGSVVFVLDVHNAKDVQSHSWFGSAEGELLLNPNMEFLGASIPPIDRGCGSDGALLPVTQELHEETEGPLAGCKCICMQQIPNDTLWS